MSAYQQWSGEGQSRLKNKHPTKHMSQGYGVARAGDEHPFGGGVVAFQILKRVSTKIIRKIVPVYGFRSIFCSF